MIPLSRRKFRPIRLRRSTICGIQNSGVTLLAVRLDVRDCERGAFPLRLVAIR
jgi:hypothetical protein